MSDLIKREDAIKAINLRARIPHDVVSAQYASMAINAIRSVPSADRPQGEWIDIGDFEQCSVCKGTRLKEFQSYYGKVTWIKTPYCPSCGARMKGANNDL